VRAYSAISALDVLRRPSTLRAKSGFSLSVEITFGGDHVVIEIRVDPGAMGFEPARLERIRPHFDAYVEDRRLAGWLATVARGGELVWTAKGGYRDERRISRSPTTRSGVSIR